MVGRQGSAHDVTGQTAIRVWGETIRLKSSARAISWTSTPVWIRLRPNGRILELWKWDEVTGHDGFLDTFITLVDQNSHIPKSLVFQHLEWADNIPDIELSLLSPGFAYRTAVQVSESLHTFPSQRTSRCC